jgi:lipopolysaccharide/colanic/teichoic acid biosynthesis glycosyltransferase
MSLRFFDPLDYCDGDVCVAPIAIRAPAARIGAVVRRGAAIKRGTDIVLAMTALTLLAGPMLLAAAMIRLTSRGPAVFSQERIGLNGRPFRMLKFRTMRHQADAEPCRQATRHDPRVTWFGAILRRTSFDEVPQFLNVLAGTMSVVGPRPHAPGTCVAGRPFETITGRYAARHSVRPGLTGLAQVRGWRGETDTEDKFIRRLESDLEYIATWSPGRDLLIIGRTIIAVLRMRNAY